MSRVWEPSSFTAAVQQPNPYNHPRWYWNTMRDIAKAAQTGHATTSLKEIAR